MTWSPDYGAKRDRQKKKRPTYNGTERARTHSLFYSILRRPNEEEETV
jgi:hypothetical protein